MTLSPNANTVYRDFVSDGIPSSGEHDPQKSDIRAWGTAIETSLKLISANPGLIFPDKATMDSTLTYGQGQMAWVLGDPVAANNGIYRKLGASGTGSWLRLGDLPYSLIKASDVGAGTANAVQATTSVPIPAADGGALIWLNIFEANTSSPVTVSFNGGSALTIKTNSGNDISAGGLTAGMIVLGLVSGSTFRLVSDQASAAVLAACEAAQAAAEAAAASVNIRNVATRTALKALDTAVTTLTFLGEAGREGFFEWTPGDFSTHVATDTGEGVFIKADAVASTAGAWVRVYDEVDVRWFGAAGNGSNATTAFAAAISLSQFLGLNRVVCKSSTEQFKIVELHITDDVEIDLGGATILGDFGPWGTHSTLGTPIHWTKNVFFSTAANAPSVKLKNLTINGQSDPAFLMTGGTPLIDFRGAAAPGRCVIEFDNVTITRGSNRIYTAGSGISIPTLLLDARNMEVLIYNADEVWINDLEFRSSPGEYVQIQSDDRRTKVRINRYYATKARDSDGARWSTSALNVLNCHPTSEIRNSRFWLFIKSAINWESDGGLIESCEFEDINDSNALDFNEASSYRFNQFVVRNCYFRDVFSVGIRASSSNTLFENNTFENVNICISYEADVAGDGARGAWLKANDVILANNVVRNCWVKSFNPSHTSRIGIRALGKDASTPIQLTIEGGSVVDRQPSSGRAQYGVFAKDAGLQLSGYLGDGDAALVYMTGTMKVRARDLVLAPEPGASVHSFHFDGATLGPKDFVIEASTRVTALDAGNYDLRVDSTTLDIDAIHINGSPTFTATSNSTLAISRDGCLKGTATFDPPSIAAGASTSTTVTVTGARLGDRAEAFINTSQSGLVLSAYVSASNTVTVIYFNPTGAAVDLASHTLTLWVKKPLT